MSAVRHHRGMSADEAAAERPPPTTIAEAIGGPLGMAETALPGVAFVVAYTVSGSNVKAAAIVAVGLALVLTVVRLVKRESPRHALSGLLGVAFAAFIALRTGKAEDYYLPGLLFNAGWVVALVVSNLVRWPLIGVVVANLDGEDTSWRDDSRRVRAFRRATWLWVGLFAARLAVQAPLYIAARRDSGDDLAVEREVVALGVARTAMGLPLFAIGLWLTWLIVRGARAPASAPAPPAQS
jgi:hypothetical protein